MDEDLLKKIEDASKNIKGPAEVTLTLTPRQLQYIKIWIKTSYAYEDALSKELGI
jgi:hypothetical protein